MLTCRGLVGVVGGVVLAMVGPAGIAIGHFSHPVGEASHPEAGAVFGTVVAADTQEPLEGVCVSIRPSSWTSSSNPSPASHSRGLPRYADRRTDHDGHYFTGNLRPGSYRVHFDATCPSSTVRNTYASEWAHDALRAKDAARIRVRQGETAIVNEDLQPASTILGTVADELGAAPTTCVTAYLADSDRFDVRWPDSVRNRESEVVARGKVEAGEFRIRGLGAANYRLLIGCLTDDWAEEAPAPFGYIPSWAPTLNVEPGAEVVADTVTISGAGSITGKVVDQFGRKRRDACVDAWVSSTKAVGGYHAHSSTFDGARLPAGEYRVSASQYWCSSWSWGYDEGGLKGIVYYPAGHTSHPFDRAWFQNAETFGAATPVEVVNRRATRTDMTVQVLGPDVNVVSLEVTDPKIKTAFTEIPSPGLRKEIRVNVREDGLLRPNWYWPWYNSTPSTRVQLVIWAVSRSSRANNWDMISSSEFTLAEGESRNVSVSWTPAGSLGDLDIVAKACVPRYPSYPFFGLEGDVFAQNNTRVQETFVGVGGLGGASGLVPRAWFNEAGGC